MKSLQLLAGACAVLLASSLVVAAPPAPPSPEVQTLITEGQTAYQRGDIEKAKAAFEMAYSMDSRNVIAIGYLRRIKADEATKPKPVDRERQLASIVIPQIQFRDATVSSALDFIKKSVEKQTGGQQSISFVVQFPAEQVNSQTVTLNLANIPVTEALRYLGELVNATFVYEKYAVIMKPKPGAVTPAPTTTVTIPQSAPPEGSAPIAIQ